jgi:hypothetical protein
MSTTTSITTTYAGEFAGKYIAAALLPAPTLASNLITIMPNVKFKSVMKRLATDKLLSNASCDFNPAGTITLTERVIQPKELQVNRQLCKTTFRNDWDAIEMGYSAFDVMPKSFTDFLLAQYAEKVASENEVNIHWLYKAGDEAMKEAGEDFNTIVNLPFHILSTENS